MKFSNVHKNQPRTGSRKKCLTLKKISEEMRDYLFRLKTKYNH